MSSYDIERIKDYVSMNKIEQVPERAEIDLTCPYLTDGKLCAVYDARPDICRVYRCDIHAKGIHTPHLLLMNHHPYSIQDLREVIDDEEKDHV